jgi:membrane-associated protease RseP (regulator of RpoE activity)
VTIRSQALIALSVLALVGGSAVRGADTPTPPATNPPAAADQKPFLGIQVDSTKTKTDGGIEVSAVLPNSTASAMGLLAGDIITAINKHPMAGMDDLQKEMGGAKVGDAITVDVLRKTEKLTLSGQLQAKPAPPENPVTAIPKLKAELEDLKKRRDREPSLAEMLDDIVTKLNDLEKNLPKAAEAFKKQYPNGEFSITISITISSDKNAKNAVQLGNQDGAKKDDAKKDDAPKDATPKKDDAPKDATAPTPKPPPAPSK